MYRYKVTAIAIVVSDWTAMRQAIFGQSEAVFEQYGGSIGQYHFSTPQTPADLGPLVKVELLPSE
jgi:hypothetical protein